MVTLEQLAGAPSRIAALPGAGRCAAVEFPAADRLDDELAARFLHGQRLALAARRALPQAGRVRVYRQSDSRLLGTAQLKDYGVLAPERLVKS